MLYWFTISLMSVVENYNGQDAGEPETIPGIDGKYLFTEQLRTLAHAAVAAFNEDRRTMPNKFLESNLRRLANQTPPSHQARYFMDKLELPYLMSKVRYDDHHASRMNIS
jgi:hypothetical protein